MLVNIEFQVESKADLYMLADIAKLTLKQGFKTVGLNIEQSVYANLTKETEHNLKSQFSNKEELLAYTCKNIRKLKTDLDLF